MQLTPNSSDLDVFSWLDDIVTEIDDIFLRKRFCDCSVSESINDDLGLDSLGRINLFYGIIDAIDIEIDEAAVEFWVSVKDVLTFVREQLGK